MRHLEMEGEFERFYIGIGGRRYFIDRTREESVGRRGSKDA
jgi:hypothetical protein